VPADSSAIINYERRKIVMNRIVGIALLVGGVVLMVFGFMAADSFGSDVSRFFTGSPTDKAIWMIIGGIVASIVGLGLTLSGKHA
jgi:NO-binding membrane sensor protein with MHYT domain